LKSGAPGEIRTPDLLLRRQSLYPAELRARYDFTKFTSLHAAQQSHAQHLRGVFPAGKECAWKIN
jgi:hypothetical protein